MLATLRSYLGISVKGLRRNRCRESDLHDPGTLLTQPKLLAPKQHKFVGNQHVCTVPQLTHEHHLIKLMHTDICHHGDQPQLAYSAAHILPRQQRTRLQQLPSDEPEPWFVMAR